MTVEKSTPVEGHKQNDDSRHGCSEVSHGVLIPHICLISCGQLILLGRYGRSISRTVCTGLPRMRWSIVERHFERQNIDTDFENNSAVKYVLF
jgi:hypothetical protein